MRRSEEERDLESRSKRLEDELKKRDESMRYAQDVSEYLRNEMHQNTAKHEKVRISMRR